jgi:hypothetical protein
VAPSWRLRRRQVEDGRVDAMGCVGPCYPTSAIFNVLCPRGKLKTDGSMRWVEDGRVDAMGCVRLCYPTSAVCVEPLILGHAYDEYLVLA